jgi:hypothetical protein
VDLEVVFINRMAPVIFRCPATGLNVQGWFADDGSANDGKTYETVTCAACRMVHLVNSKTGKALGAGEK